MLSMDTLNRQNHEIAELTKVLAHLIGERELCDTAIANDLLDRYVERVQEHFERNNTQVYGELLTHRDVAVNNTARRFLEGEKEIKRLFNDFVGRWCRSGLHIDNHERFLSEAGDIFRLVSRRIQAECEELYPLARRVDRGTQIASHA
ncbi:hemerythrin domain-containing protein [Thioalkalivibrio paradoxus]|uniref:Hemerythrin-like domain-containing protein n=1 Tax=Thioalkalivibrio paradoxus ARh 1 TaxID=713585 RepID=W0DK27_9GAMM|nr:hemerythrin domain-containing protein [Thioalkalivibrio paradoxus]AHE98801.1 hypothetical protein THITH_11705 [Thioalkalivibrio paradoxus ARh 1]